MADGLLECDTYEMGCLDLKCIATGLAILGDDTRAVFFYVRGQGTNMAPITLPMRGSWDGYTPALDDTWHARSVHAALVHAVRDGSLLRAGRESTPYDYIDLDIVGSTLSSTSVQLAKEKVMFAAVLESAFDAVLQATPRSDALQKLPRPELLQRAIPDLVLAESAYASVPDEELSSACADLCRFREWFEAGNVWCGAIGNQYQGEELNELIAEAEPRLVGHGEALDRAFATVLAAYRDALPSSDGGEDEDEDEGGANEFMRDKLAEHIQRTRQKRPTIDAAALAGSIEMFRILQNLSLIDFPAGSDSNANKLKWKLVIERVGMNDAIKLAAALLMR